MREKEQKQFDKAAQKKALIGNGIILFVLVIGIILAVFAWFTTLDDISRVRGMSYVSVDDLDIRFNTYPGTEQSGGAVVYDENPLMNLNNEDFDEEQNEFVLFPGERKHFKTVISNYEHSAYIGNFVIQNILVNSGLVTTNDTAYITFTADMGENTQEQGYNLEQATDYKENGVVSSTLKMVNSQSIYKNIHIDALDTTQSPEVPGTVTVYWYVTLNGSAVDNSFMGQSMMKFQRVKFITAH